MYDENSFKNYIFWLQVKRVFLMILFAVIGAFIGIVLSQFLIDILLVLDPSYKVVIITISTLLFFGISLLLTAGTGKEVQEGYWKMAVLRKLTVISKKLDNLENLDEATPEQKEVVKKVIKEVKEEIHKEPEMEQLSFDYNDTDDINIDDKEDNKKQEDVKKPEPKQEPVKKDFAGNVVTTPQVAEPKKSPTKRRITKLAKNK